MPLFFDDMLVRLSDDAYVESLLTTASLRELFSITYVEDGRAADTVSFASVVSRETVMPVFETVRIKGSRLHTGSQLQRTEITEEHPRQGRLGWVDTYLVVRVNVTTQSTEGPLESIQAADFSEMLGALDSFDALRTALADRYSDSIVDAFLDQLEIRTLDDFERRQHLFVEFVAAPPEDDPPASTLSLPLRVCVLIQPDGIVADALQRAKTIRQLIQHETVLAPVDGFSVDESHVLLTLFPTDSVDDQTLTGQTAAEARTTLQQLFSTEKMHLHFASV